MIKALYTKYQKFKLFKEHNYISAIFKKLRKLSGFAKPCPVSSALCVFIGQPVGTDMARTEVTKFLTRYIKEHDLQDKDDRRKIVPDKKLGKLLGSKKSDVVTYFNLQSYLKQHFPKAAAVAK